jgi:hypothetical protein
VIESRPEKDPAMIHELRIYHCVPGRLPALLKRFETVALAAWERHGIRQAGFWTVTVGPSNQDLYYLLAWDSLAARDEMVGVHGRPGMAREARRIGKGRPDHRLDHEPHPAADGFLGGAVRARLSVAPSR